MADQTTPADPPAEANGTPEYGASYYQGYCGIPYERSEHWLTFFGNVADGIVRDIRPSSVLDAGCAMGFLVEALHRRGVDAWGVDVSEYAISQAHESVADRCRAVSLTEPLERRYDLITCIEVVEHIPPAEVDRVIANLCAATDMLLLSTTPENYDEATHLNVQQPEEWAAALAREGFLRDLDHDFSYVTPWASLYRRVEQPLEETVRDYDRAWSRLRKEVGDVRGALLETQERLDSAEDPSGFESRSELGAEVDRLKEENLRLRDLLVGRDAELGAARGQLASANANIATLANVVGHLQEGIPGLLRLVRTILRKLLGRRG
jgi:2-polyprenyl-3-methyl-5-hydroxy-6-metoxy-1,4-benzoquinol methylase